MLELMVPSDMTSTRLEAHITYTINIGNSPESTELSTNCGASGTSGTPNRQHSSHNHTHCSDDKKQEKVGI